MVFVEVKRIKSSLAQNRLFRETYSSWSVTRQARFQTRLFAIYFFQNSSSIKTIVTDTIHFFRSKVLRVTVSFFPVIGRAHRFRNVDHCYTVFIDILCYMQLYSRPVDREKRLDYSIHHLVPYYPDTTSAIRSKLPALYSSVEKVQKYRWNVSSCHVNAMSCDVL